MDPVISVIIPTYNMGEYCPEAVQSVLDGTFDDVDILVVDDGSTDATETVLRSFKEKIPSGRRDRIILLRQEHRGKAAAVNKGLDAARGRYICVLDADDRLTRESLKLRYEIAEGRGADLVLGGFSTFDRDEVFGYRRPPKNRGRTSLVNRLLFNVKSPFHMNAMLFSSELVGRAGRMDERLLRAQDKDYAIRLIRAADSVEIVDKPVYLYRRYDRGYANRFKNRLRTLRYKSLVVSKHTSGLKKIIGLAWGLLIEIGKMGYELFGIYRK